MAPFLVATPDDTTAAAGGGDSAVDGWVAEELSHLLNRWAGLFRGDARVKKASDVTEQDKARFNLVLWGTPATNSIVADFLSTPELPFAWDGTGCAKIGEREFRGPAIVPQLIFPSPFGAGRYVLLNSGTTFREGHDTTNSMQNAKLPDWAVVDVTTAPSPVSPGRVVLAGFCDEKWFPIVNPNE